MKIQIILFEAWDAWKCSSPPSMLACVNELIEIKARNWEFSCYTVFNYSYFLGMVLVRLISTISDNAWVRIRGQHSLRTNQWNHPVLGCVTAGDTFPLPTELLSQRRGSPFCQSHSPREQPAGRGGDHDILWGLCSQRKVWFPAFQETAQTIKGKILRKWGFWMIFFQFNPYT